MATGQVLQLTFGGLPTYGHALSALKYALTVSVIGYGTGTVDAFFFTLVSV